MHSASSSSFVALDHQHRADSWTKLGVAAEVFQGIISNFLLFGPSIDNVMDWEVETPYGMSWTSSGIASVLAIAITVGTGYCSYLLQLLAQRQAALAGQPHLANIPRVEIPLSKAQKVAWGLNYIGCTAEVAGPANFVISLVTNDRLSRWTQVGVNAALTTMGFLGARAKGRTAKQNILEHNRVTAASAKAEPASDPVALRI